jgi:tRNA nucleotidyltransferase (CCA-adding enzyme)
VSDGGGGANLLAPAEVVRIARRLEECGFSAWAVGGAVRDALAGGHPEDWDLATSARPSDVQRIFRRTVPLGIDHGTVGVIARSGRMYEVTTFRRDVETFGRRARVAFADRLEDDLERRDFTINAVAWHPLTHELRDPHGGVRDLAGRVLRTVGDPQQRFAEDRLRVLRALRFAGRFGLRIEPTTWSALEASARQLGKLSAERVREELWKVLSGQREPSLSLELYATSGVLAALYPELEACREIYPEETGGVDLWRFLLRTVDAVSAARPLLRLTALLHGLGYTAPAPAGSLPAHDRAARGAACARELLRRLRSSNAHADRVTHLIAHHEPLPAADAPDPALRRWIRGVGRDYLNDLFRLAFARCRARAGDGDGARRLLQLHARAATLLRARPPLHPTDLPVTGADLRAAGLAPGPVYSRILDELLERVTDEPSLNERQKLLELVSELARRTDDAPRP